MSDFMGKFCPQSCRPVRLGGEPGLTASDLSHACTNTSEMGYAIVCMKYANDFSLFAALQKMLSNRIIEEARQDHWKKSRLPGLIKLAVYEYCGTRILRDTDRARVLGVSPSTWCRVWKGKYNRLLEIMEAYEQGAIHIIKNRLK